MTSNPNWATDEESKNIYIGEQAIIIGRGVDEYSRNVSLDSFPGIKIGCNGAYQVVNKLDALVWLDPEFFKRNWENIAKLDCFKFAIEPIHYDHHVVTIRGLMAKRPEKCSDSFKKGFYPCNLSGYIALNLALIFGCNPIWLYGFCPQTEELQKRSDSFETIAKWAFHNNRKIYIANEESYLGNFFEYKAIPQLDSSPE